MQQASQCEVDYLDGEGIASSVGELPSRRAFLELYGDPSGVLFSFPSHCDALGILANFLNRVRSAGMFSGAMILTLSTM